MFSLLNSKEKPKEINRHASLSSIRYSTASMEKDNFGPRAFNSFFISFVLTAITSIPISFFMDKYSINSYFFIALIGISCGSFVCSYFMSSIPKTWKEHLDLILSQYDPVNKYAFIELQTTIKNDGWRAEAIYNWIEFEKSQLIADDLKKTSLAPSLFLEKDLR